MHHWEFRLVQLHGLMQRLFVEESQKWWDIIIILLCPVIGWWLPGRHMVSAGKLRLKAILVDGSLLKRDLSRSLDSMAATGEEAVSCSLPLRIQANACVLWNLCPRDHILIWLPPLPPPVFPASLLLPPWDHFLYKSLAHDSWLIIYLGKPNLRYWIHPFKYSEESLNIPHPNWRIIFLLRLSLLCSKWHLCPPVTQACDSGTTFWVVSLFYTSKIQILFLFTH